MADEAGKLKFLVEVDSEKAQSSLKDFDKSIDTTEENVKQAEEKTGSSFENISAKSVAMAVAIGSAVVAMGKSVIDATTEIQSGQANIVNATGATGEALGGLMDSAKNVYAQAGESFDEVSRAIGEVNTRLGLTGGELEKTTDDFLMFSGATGQDVQQSVISVTQAMNKWGLEAEDIPSVLDKLTYAGQASGVSVSTLTTNLTANAGTLQAMGYSMDEAIAMMMQFELQGIDSNSVIMGMKKSFEDSALAGTDAREDWENLLDSITNATTQTEANSIAVETFGSRIATDMVTALQDGKLNFDEFTTGVQNANGVLATTDEASKTTADRIEELKHSITLMLSDVGAELAPMVEEMLPTVKELLSSVFSALSPIIPVLGDLVATLLPPMVEIITTLADALVPIVEAILPPLKSLLMLVGGILSSLLVVLNPILGVVGDLLEVGINLVTSILNPLLSILTPIFSALSNAVSAILTPLTQVLGKIVSWIEGLINGIKWLVGWIGDGIASFLGLNTELEQTGDNVVNLTGKVEDSNEATKDYTASTIDLTDEINEANKAFLDGVDAQVKEKEAKTEATEATEDHAEAVETETEKVAENSDAVENNTEKTKGNTEAQKEAERLEKERSRNAETWTEKLKEQAETSEKATASQLESEGKITEAYDIRLNQLERQKTEELALMQEKVDKGEATEAELQNIRTYYENERVALVNERNAKIQALNEKAMEAEREESERNAEEIRKANEKAEQEKQKAIAETEATEKRLAETRKAESDSWIDRLEQQEVQQRQNTATELEAMGQIDEAYAIRAELIDAEMKKEVKALEQKVAENKATEQDILNAKKYYANLQEQNNKKKNEAIQKQEKKTADEAKALEEEKTAKLQEEEEKRVRLEEEAEQKRRENFQATNSAMEDAVSALHTSISTSLTNLLHVMGNEFANMEDKTKALRDVASSLMGTLGDMMSAFVKDLVTGENAWKNLGKTALLALAQIVKALAEEMTARAVLALFSQQYVSAGLLTAGAVAGYASAGLIEGYANTLAIGKDYVPYDEYPAKLHKGEMVLTKVEAEKLRNMGGLYGVEQMMSEPLSVATANGINSVNVNSNLSAVIEVDGTQLGIAVLKNIDNASQFVLR